MRQFCQKALETEGDLSVFWSDFSWYTGDLLWLLVVIATVWNKDKIRQLYNTRFWETLIATAIASQCDGGLLFSIVWLAARVVLLIFAGFALGL
jgi:hypothetical protein